MKVILKIEFAILSSILLTSTIWMTNALLFQGWAGGYQDLDTVPFQLGFLMLVGFMIGVTIGAPNGFLMGLIPFRFLRNAGTSISSAIVVSTIVPGLLALLINVLPNPNTIDPRHFFLMSFVEALIGNLVLVFLIRLIFLRPSDRSS